MSDKIALGKDEIIEGAFKRINELEAENKELRDLCQKLQVAPVQQEPKYKYKVVRTYRESTKAKANNLQASLDDGWEVVRASEYVPGDARYSGYLEYILRKRAE